MIPKVFLRAENNYDMDEASLETGIKCGEVGAHQSFKDECDINTIVKRFGLTGELPSNVRMPTYGDFTGLMDYQQAQNALIAARDAFLAMPAEVRKRFDDDPGKFVAFCDDKGNLEEARKLGLVPELELHPVDPPVVKPPVDPPVVKPPAAASGTVIT